MLGSSATRVALASAVSARLQAQGHLQDGSQLAALLDDIEATINANAGTALADCAADIAPAQFGDPPLGGQ